MRIAGIGLVKETDRLLITKGSLCAPNSSDVIPDDQPAPEQGATDRTFLMIVSSEHVVITGYTTLTPSPGTFLNPYRLSVLGTYTVCVCAAFTAATEPSDRGLGREVCSTTEDFTLNAGVVRSIGVVWSSGDPVTCGAMDANCVFNFTGESFGMNPRDRVTLATAASCNGLPRRKVAISFPVYTYPGASVEWGALVPPRAIPTGANFSVCYCAAGLDDSDCGVESSFHLRAGELIVSGAIEASGNHSCVPGETCVVSIRGLSLHSRDRLKVLNSLSRQCSNIVVDKFGDKVVNVSDLTNDRRMSTFRISSFKTADSYVLCYCPFTGLPDWIEDPCSARTPHSAGKLYIEGIMPSPEDSAPALGRYKGTVTLPVRMIGRPSENWKVGLRPGDGLQCNDSSLADDVVVSEVDLRTDNHLVVDVSRLPQGRYRACGCMGECDERDSYETSVDLGTIDIISPALNVSRENSTPSYVRCAAGQPCEVSGVGDIQGAEIFLTTLSLPPDTQRATIASMPAKEAVCGEFEEEVFDTPVERSHQGTFALPRYSFGSIRSICACMKIDGSLDGWDCSKSEHFNIAIGRMVVSGPSRSSDNLRCPVQSECRVEIEGVLLKEGDRAVLLTEGQCGQNSANPKDEPAEIKLNKDKSVGEFNFGKSGSAVETYKICYCHDAASQGCHEMEEFTLAMAPLDIYFRLNAFHVLGIILGCLFLMLILRYVWVKLRRRRFATGAHQLDFDKAGKGKIGYEYTTEVGGRRGGRTKTRVAE